MDLGSGIAIAGASATTGAVVIVAIKQAYLKRKELNGNGDGKVSSQFIQRLCDERHGNIDRRLKEICDWMEKLDAKIDNIIRK